MKALFILSYRNEASKISLYNIINFTYKYYFKQSINFQMKEFI